MLYKSTRIRTKGQRIEWLFWKTQFPHVMRKLIHHQIFCMLTDLCVTKEVEDSGTYFTWVSYLPSPLWTSSLELHTFLFSVLHDPSWPLTFVNWLLIWYISSSDFNYIDFNLLCQFFQNPLSSCICLLVQIQHLINSVCQMIVE